MNPKSLTGTKRAKNGLKIEAKDGGAEIYVLPPHLLQKLGINLTNIVIPQEATSNYIVGNGNNYFYPLLFLSICTLLEESIVSNVFIFMLLNDVILDNMSKVQ